MLSLIKKYGRTCTSENPIDLSVCFASNMFHLEKLLSTGYELAILVPEGKRMGNTFMFGEHMIGNCLILPRKEHVRDFIYYHNFVNARRSRKVDHISTLAKIDERASIGNDGMRYYAEKDALVNMKHMGNVVIADYVEIGPFSSVAIATIDSTIIERHTRIGCGVHIGHNVQIGERNIIVDGTVIGGSVKIGSGCFIGLNSTIRNGVKICSNVLIGMGALVVKDINNPGVYAGQPAVKIKEWDGSF